MRVDVELLTVDQAAEVLGVSPSRVRQLREAGELPAAIAMPGPRYLFERGQVELVRAERIASPPANRPRARRKRAALAA
jgi:excisionase family DNA binding protein